MAQRGAALEPVGTPGAGRSSLARCLPDVRLRQKKAEQALRHRQAGGRGQSGLTWFCGSHLAFRACAAGTERLSVLFSAGPSILTDTMSGCRVFIGRLNPAAREKDVERFFKGYGRIRDIDLKRGFGFVVSGGA